MKKKSIIKIILYPILCILALFVLLKAPSFIYKTKTEIKYANWQIISFNEYGSFRVPKEWIYTETEDAIYFTNLPMEEENHLVYMAGTKWNKDGLLNVEITYSDERNPEWEDKYLYQIGVTIHEDKSETYRLVERIFPPCMLFSDTEYTGYCYGGESTYHTNFYLEIFKIKGRKHEKFTIGFMNEDKGIDLIVWDDSITESKVKKITKSFIRSPHVK